MKLIQVIKALSDETRLRILNLLYQGELCVCELEALLDINQSNASRHLNRIVNAGIIHYEKRAQYVYYRVDKDILIKYPFIKEILGNELIKEKGYQIDLDRLSQYRESGITCDDLSKGKLKI